MSNWYYILISRIENMMNFGFSMSFSPVQTKPSKKKKKNGYVHLLITC